MLETVITIILLPIALCAGLFTVALGVAAIKAVFRPRKKKKNENLTE